jgi:hypothetical protein
VDPRGLEPLTSAMRRQILQFIAVRRGAKTPANRRVR